MRELLIATKNPGKFHEIREVLGDGAFKLVFLGDMDVDDSDFVEDGGDFRENAWKKASYYGNKLGMMSVGEDSGIFVNALADELGLKTRRWGAGEEASDEEWIEYFLKRMEGEEDRGAKFVCWSCLWEPGVEDGVAGVGAIDDARFFDAETAGEIAEELQCDLLPGLPLSSCFVPEGFDKAYAALGVEEKNKISHRGKALKKVGEYLSNL